MIQSQNSSTVFSNWFTNNTNSCKRMGLQAILQRFLMSNLLGDSNDAVVVLTI